jgi:glycosyltransferase involved in cell wall biosynthesis
MVKKETDPSFINSSSIKVSIIMPCYNCEAFVFRAIDSVLKQTFKDWELILVNNNSADQTQQVIEEYQACYPTKISIYQEFEKGAPAARNKGLSYAIGDYIQFLDADDEILPEKIEGQYLLAIDQDSTIVASPYMMKVVRNQVTREAIRKLQVPDFWLGLIHSELGITSANLFKRSAVLEVNGWDQTLVSSQEYDLMFRILQIAPRVGLDERVQTIIHIGEGDSSSRGGGEERARMITESRTGLRLRIKSYLKSINELTPLREGVADLFIYEQLYYDYRYRPDFVKDKLKLIPLKLTLKESLKGKYFMLKMDIKRILKMK